MPALPDAFRRSAKPPVLFSTQRSAAAAAPSRAGIAPRRPCRPAGRRCVWVKMEERMRGPRAGRSARTPPETPGLLEIVLEPIVHPFDSADFAPPPDTVLAILVHAVTFPVGHHAPPARPPYLPLPFERKSEDILFLHRSPSDGPPKRQPRTGRCLPVTSPSQHIMHRLRKRRNDPPRQTNSTMGPKWFFGTGMEFDYRACVAQRGNSTLGRFGEER